MKAICIAVALGLVAVFANRSAAATLRMDADVAYTLNAADLGPASVPMIKDAAGNVLNPTIGQVYAVRIFMTISDFEELPNGNLERGFAGETFDVSLQGLKENDLRPGWHLEQQNIDLRPGPGGCCVPLWLDLCKCGAGGPLTEISVGIDVADFPRAEQVGNPAQDPRRTVGQSYFAWLGTVYVDYLGQPASLHIDVSGFDVHDTRTIFPADGQAFGDIVLFVPEPCAGALLIASVAVLARFTGELATDLLDTAADDDGE